MNGRRDFLALCLASALAPAALAQAPTYRIGLLSITPPDRFFDGGRTKILAAMGSLGYRVGQNVILDERYPKDPDETKRFAQELVALRPALIFTEGSIPTLALQRATRTVPIVTTVGDPIAAGFAKTLQRPGGNITGLSQNRAALAPKLLEILRLLRPDLRVVAAGYPADVPGADLPFRGFADAARAASLEVHLLALPDQGFDKLLDELARRRVEAVLLPVTLREWVPAANRRRIALLANGVEGVEAGALLSVENDGSEDHIHIARVMDKVLRGQRPADIPFEVATRFRSTLNAKTAAALGIRLPPEILLRVDRIVD